MSTMIEVGRCKIVQAVLIFVCPFLCEIGGIQDNKNNLGNWTELDTGPLSTFLEKSYIFCHKKRNVIEDGNIANLDICLSRPTTI